MTYVRVAFHQLTAIAITLIIALATASPAAAATQGATKPERTRVEIRSAADGVVLVGDVYAPPPRDGGPVVPGVVLLGVTGPNDRALRLGRLTPFEVLARYLAMSGVAVLTFDDRGIGESGGDWSRVGYETLVEDALSALDALGQWPAVDRSRLGFLGLSEGAGIAMMAAAAAPQRVAFLVLGSPPGLRGEEALGAQFEASLRLAGISGDAAGPWRDRFTEFIQLAKAGDRVSLERFLSSVRAPVLVIGGALDPILPPELHHPPLHRGLGHTDFEAPILPGLNHLLLPARTGMPTEYATIQESADPRVLALIVDWLARRSLR